MSKIPSINSNKDFSNIYKKGKKWYCSGAIIFYLVGVENKLAVVASKKVGNAVLRNRSKRLLRAIFSSLSNELSIGSYVFIARTEISQLSFLELERNLKWGLKKLGCLE